MSFDDLNARLGLVALAVSAFLIIYAIPQWVFSPSNVGNIVLSPTFWPYVLSGFLAITGVGLLLTPAKAPEQEEASQTGLPWLRLGGLAVVMMATMWAMPVLGMVWTCMIVFIATAFLFRTRYPKTALVCAVLIPLFLYAFFAHVAGVAIPQGEFVRLP